MKPLTTFQTERLVLRPTKLADLADYHALLTDLAKHPYSLYAPGGLLESEERLLRVLARQATGELMGWSLIERGRTAMIGTITLVRINKDHERAEVGYQLRSDHQGKGFMTEALTRLVAHAFSDLNLHRLEGHAHPDNARSIRVLERCGFVREGLLRENYLMNGVFYDSAVYGRLRDQR